MEGEKSSRTPGSQLYPIGNSEFSKGWRNVVISTQPPLNLVWLEPTNMVILNAPKVLMLQLLKDQYLVARTNQTGWWAETLPSDRACFHSIPVRGKAGRDPKWSYNPVAWRGTCRAHKGAIEIWVERGWDHPRLRPSYLFDPVIHTGDASCSSSGDGSSELQGSSTKETKNSIGEALRPSRSPASYQVLEQ